MKVLKPRFEIIPQESGITGMFKHIETCGRVCYKSENKITETSHEDFLQMLLKKNHTAVFEHGTVYLVIPGFRGSLGKFYIDNKYSTVTRIKPPDNVEYMGDDYYVTTNYRVLAQKYRGSEDLQYYCTPTKHHEKRYTVKFICDRGISHEYVRNRGKNGNGFAQESTRYCNYSKAKSNNEISIIHPCWMDYPVPETSFDNFKRYCFQIGSNGKAIGEFWEDLDYWLFANMACEFSYINLIRLGWSAQKARSVLPTDLKTELIITATISDWEHFFYLRCDSSAHPQARELAIPLQEEFIKLNYL